MAIDARVLIRKPEIKPDLLRELETTAVDRIKLRIGESSLPIELESIAVEVICAMHNRLYHEGIKTESVDIHFSTTFMDDILKEFESDLALYVDNREKANNAKRGVMRFL